MTKKAIYPKSYIKLWHNWLAPTYPPLFSFLYHVTGVINICFIPFINSYFCVIQFSPLPLEYT